MIDLSKYDQDIEYLKQDIMAIREASKTFEPIPPGKYEVAIDRLEMKETKARNALMLSVAMTILEGQFRNRKIFFNKMLNSGRNIENASYFLKSLGTGEKVDFDNFNQYNDVIKAIEFTIHNVGLEYEIEYTRTEKDGKSYDNYKVISVFED